MIRICRDPDFWTAVASHPALAGALHGLDPARIGALARLPAMLPLAAEHGGYLLAAMDGFGFVRELHTLFTPEGWGREALMAGIEGLALLFAGPCQAIVTYEVEGMKRSRPPLTFGFERGAEDFVPTPVGPLRTWVLTRQRWMASSAKRRETCQ